MNLRRRKHGERHGWTSILQWSALLLLAWAAVPHAAAQNAQSKGTAELAPPGWKSYSYPSEGFRAAFPSEPKMSSQNVNTAAGAFELRDYLVDLGSTALYIGVCDYGSSMSGRDPQTVLDGAQSGAITNVKGTLISSSNISLGSHRGREFEAANDQLHFSARIYLVGTVLYQTLIAYPVNTHYQYASRFLDSFELTPRSDK